MEGKVLFDGHCHIFTLKYPLKEIKSILWETLLGEYPWAEREHDPKKTSQGAPSQQTEKMKETLRQFYETLLSAMGSEEKNLDFLQRQAKSKFPEDPWIITPLMMDVFYMFAKPVEAHEHASKEKPQAWLDIQDPDHHKIAQEIWDTILDDLKSHIHRIHQGGENQRVRSLKGELQEILEILEMEREFKLSQDKALFHKTRSYGFHKTAGYCHHYDRLLELCKKRPGELYPFIAIDPRREGVIDSLLSGEYVEKGPFLGVKLYPRMGYHPQCEALKPVYAYCESKGIPITFHCGTGGFPPGDDWKYAKLGDPENFRPVLEAHPEIRIDFAHLGNGDRSWGWAETIVDFMGWHKGVYSDLSCYTEMVYLDYARKLWDQNPVLRERLMYGTDFDVMYFAGATDMSDYVENFRKKFSPEELNWMMSRNVHSFLGI